MFFSSAFRDCTRFAAVLIVTLSIAATYAQRLNPSALDLINGPRLLTPAEIPVVLAAVREAVAGKTVRLAYSPGGFGPEAMIGMAGRPRFVRATSGVGGVNFTDYTGRPARGCDGTSLDRELVIEYEQRSTDTRWTAKARARASHEPLSPVFEMLDGTTSPETTQERRQISGRSARALVSEWRRTSDTVPSGSGPADGTQALWIDTASLLPLEWSVSIRANPDHGIPSVPELGLFFTYDSSLDLRPPENVVAPDCVP
jgi:hypothetical protein